MIITDDVKKVANDLNFVLSDNDIDWIITEYTTIDSDENWETIVENILYSDFSCQQT
jgi:hypothetical protein